LKGNKTFKWDAIKWDIVQGQFGAIFKLVFGLAFVKLMNLKPINLISWKNNNLR
jgi:hypothetical protein